MSERSLCHFTLFAVADEYWSLEASERGKLRSRLLDALRSAAPRVDVYQVYPTRSGDDLLVWCSTPADGPEVAASFFEGFARATNPFRRYVRPTRTLWGNTRRSTYGSGSSTQEIDPFAEERKRYLVVYPFGKTADWYLKSRDARQGMMNEHIRIGRQYPEIRQLLLYSFGLQDQEFVVVYETDDLVRFSELVQELRGSEARLFTSLDTPTYTAVYHPAEETLALWE